MGLKPKWESPSPRPTHCRKPRLYDGRTNRWRRTESQPSVAIHADIILTQPPTKGLLQTMNTCFSGCGLFQKMVQVWFESTMRSVRWLGLQIAQNSGLCGMCLINRIYPSLTTKTWRYLLVQTGAGYHSTPSRISWTPCLDRSGLFRLPPHPCFISHNVMPHGCISPPPLVLAGSISYHWFWIRFSKRSSGVDLDCSGCSDILDILPFSVRLTLLLQMKRTGVAWESEPVTGYELQKYQESMEACSSPILQRRFANVRFWGAP